MTQSRHHSRDHGADRAPGRKVRVIGETGKPRLYADAYMTPEWVWYALLANVKLRSDVWEPACGTGNGVGVLQRAGLLVFATDIQDYRRNGSLGACGGCADGVGDFLRWDSLPGRLRTIATNPPYSLQDQFIEKALDLMRPVGGMVCLLLNNNTDTAKGRRKLFGDCPAFAGKLVLTKRIAWFGGPGARQNHAWYIWDFAHQTRLSGATLGYA